MSYDDADLSEDELMSKRIVMYLFKFAEEAEAFKYYNYPVNQLFGVQNGFPIFMEFQHQINNSDDAKYYLSRLKQLPRKFTQVLQGLKLRAANRILPTKFDLKGFHDVILKNGAVPLDMLEIFVDQYIKDKS